jgi:hypothetical protein
MRRPVGKRVDFGCPLLEGGIALDRREFRFRVRLAQVEQRAGPAAQSCRWQTMWMMLSSVRAMCHRTNAAELVLGDGRQ